jgi:ATP-dependent helicase/nuclease subunit B
MAWRWWVGPPGSGKTERAVAAARAAAAAGGRVAWIGLPTQRDQVLRRLVADGPLLGVEFLSFQQLALLQLGRAGRLRPQVVGTARLALVAEALASVAGALPTPGEAQLFARAIAEAKRHGLTAAALARLAADAAAAGGAGAEGARVGAGDPRGAAEIERLADVAAVYERTKGDAWDDDDVRSAAWDAAGGATPTELRRWLAVDLLVVDGWRELPPGDLAWLRSLAAAADVVVTVASEPPPGLLAADAVVERLAARPTVVEAWRFANPVAEVRWVLRALARDLAGGIDPRDLVVVAPRGAARSLLALAGEFGVVLADEAPRALVDLPFGRLLVDLLELPEHPTATRLLAVPALVPLGRRALAEGVSGHEAIARLADAEGVASSWRDWLAALTPPADTVAWARGLTAMAGDLLGGAGGATLARAQEAALRRAQEAARLATGDGFRAWWVALLRASTLRERARPGVALVEPRRAAGRRFRRAYLVGAVAGAYDVGEREDYFVAEELRVPWSETTRPDGAPVAALPRRHRGLDDAWRAELRSRADVVVVTHADGDRGGPLRADAALIGAPGGAPAPPVPTASALEAGEARPFVAVAATEPGGAATVETLRRARACPFRAWALPLVGVDPTTPWSVRARRALTVEGGWSEERRAALTATFPMLGPWLEDHAAALARLRFGVRLTGEGAVARLDAVERGDGVVRLVRFTLPDEAPLDVLHPDHRWTELWAADLLRRRHATGAPRVEVVAWPLGGAPRSLTPDGVDTPELAARRRRLRQEVEAARAAWCAGPPAPAPGFRCRGCPVADVCREGATAA